MRRGSKHHQPYGTRKRATCFGDPPKKDGGYPFRLGLWPDDGFQVPFLLNFH